MLARRTSGKWKIIEKGFPENKILSDSFVYNGRLKTDNVRFSVGSMGD